MLTNAGQANAATGDQGYEDAVNCATLAAASLGVSPDDVLLMSTGVRGVQPAAAGHQPQQQKYFQGSITTAAAAGRMTGPPVFAAHCQQSC